MSLIPDKATVQNSFAALPLSTYRAGDTIITDGSRTGRLLILKKGTVAIVKEGTEIAQVSESGAVFGELSALLDQPHASDVRALEISQFYVADAATLLRVDPVALLYVATVLARRLDDANQALIELRRQLEAGRPRGANNARSEQTYLNALNIHQNSPNEKFFNSALNNLALKYYYLQAGSRFFHARAGRCPH